MKEQESREREKHCQGGGARRKRNLRPDAPRGRQGWLDRHPGWQGLLGGAEALWLMAHPPCTRHGPAPQTDRTQREQSCPQTQASLSPAADRPCAPSPGRWPPRISTQRPPQGSRAAPRLHRLLSEPGRWADEPENVGNSCQVSKGREDGAACSSRQTEQPGRRPQRHAGGNAGLSSPWA